MFENRKVACIGGGTGMSTMLRGLKAYTEELTAIVTVADNGGNSGILRKEMNMLPPGDIRNCLVALAETEPIMQEVLQYRFKEGALKGQNIGNLFLAALTDIYGDFETAVSKANDILAVKGEVIPVTLQDIQLKATFEDGTRTFGEHEIVYMNKVVRKKIHQIELVPEAPEACEKAVEALAQAELIILGPGSLYTSIIPNLLVSGIVETIQLSKARVIYVSNIMTQPGETDDYTLSEHVVAIEDYLGENVIEYIIANSTAFPEAILEKYKADGAIPVINDMGKNSRQKVVEADFALYSTSTNYVRHDAKNLADIIMRL